jgi:tRNA pseudouridine38-40 synthase
LAVSPFPDAPLPVGTRLACRIEYNGSRFNGWQSQALAGVVAIQDVLQNGLSAVADTAIHVHCAGRTDTGVHAFCQLIHFDTPATRSCKAWVIGGNASLPYDIRLHWAIPVEGEFHARFSAQARCYRYIIANTTIRPALMQGQITWHRRPLDAYSMHCAAQVLCGEQDFSAFRAASCQSRTPMRNVKYINVVRRGELVVIEIKANAFLHHMVRNIAGALLAVGDGRRPQAWIADLLAGKDRSVAAQTAPPDGLYLVDVEYPDHFTLPPTPYGPLLLGPEPLEQGRQ